MFEKINLKFKKESFEKENDISKIRTAEFSLPLVNAKDGDNGIMYYGREEDFDSAEMTIDIVNDGAVSTGNVYSQPQKTGILYNAYLIKSKNDINSQQLHFFASAIYKSIKQKFGYEYKASWDRVKMEKIQLPTKNGKIDFDFMESFIAELETQHIAELEAYLTVSGLDNYELSMNEEKTLKDFETLEFKEYDVTHIFDVKNTSNLLSCDIARNSGNTPYLCASAENNAVSSYITYNEQYIEEGNCIFIGGKTFVVSYQEKDFYSNDSHNLALYLKNGDRTKLKQLYIAVCVYRSLSYKYSWGNSVSKTKIKTDKVSLPSKNGKPDFESMETFISAIQKLVIKDVVLYADRKMELSKKAVSKNN